MPLPNQLSRLSARAAYSRNAPKIKQDEVYEKKGRGRPRKYPIKKEENVLKKAKGKVLAKKTKKFIGVKRGRAKVEHNSSEADCSSSENSSENDENETKTSEEDVNEENRTKRKSKSVNNQKKNDEDEASEGEEQVIVKVKGSNKNKKKPAVEENEENAEEEDDEENCEEEEEENDDEDDVLYSFAKKKTAPVKKKRKLMIETVPGGKKDSVEKEINIEDEDSDDISIDSNHPNPSKQKKIQLNKNGKSAIKSEKENIDCNGDESSSSHISSNEVDIDDDLSSNNNGEFSTSVNDQATEFRELMDNSLLTPIIDKVTKLPELMGNSSSKAKSSVPNLMNSSSSKAKISSYVERNRTAKCGNFAAQEAFQWLISPVNHKVFFDVIFERQPYHIRRKNAIYYQGLFSCNDLETMIKENNLVYDEHVDVLKYENFKRVHTSLKGKAIYSNIWDDFKEGYSVRVRNPQMYNKNLWNFCSLLQEYFSSVVGVNIYLTPPNSQGFPPHYDDIDAFIVQTGGSKKWKVYAPRNPNENLGRYPSKDFGPDELGTPLMEITVKAGDFLYIPRGYIHQAETQEDDYSLHLTFSSNQMNTWGDLLVEALGKAMDHAILNEIDLRKSLPKDYTDYVGTAVSNMNFSPQRNNFIKEFQRLAKRSLTYLSADEGADTHALKVLHTALPPVLNKIEKNHSIHGNGSHWMNGGVKQVQYPKLNTKIQLLRRRNIRLIVEDGIGKVYHTFENEREPRPLPEFGVEVDHPFVEINLEEVPAFVFLLKHSPNFVAVHELPMNKKSEKLSFVRTLYESGLLMTQEPLNFQNEDQSNSTKL